MYDIQNVECTSTPEELDVCSKQFHDTCTGNCRYAFTNVFYDPDSFIHVDIIGMSGFQP